MFSPSLQSLVRNDFPSLDPVAELPLGGSPFGPGPCVSRTPHSAGPPFSVVQITRAHVYGVAYRCARGFGSRN